MNTQTKVASVIGGVGIALMGSNAFATGFDPVATVTTSGTSLLTSLEGVATNVLPYAAILLAITIGWKYARRFIK